MKSVRAYFDHYRTAALRASIARSSRYPPSFGFTLCENLINATSIVATSHPSSPSAATCILASRETPFQSLASRYLRSLPSLPPVSLAVSKIYHILASMCACGTGPTEACPGNKKTSFLRTKMIRHNVNKHTSDLHQRDRPSSHVKSRRLGHNGQTENTTNTTARAIIALP